ncbi:hypothetical protein GCM10020255_093070 [Rhodococcus baikonurensis]
MSDSPTYINIRSAAAPFDPYDEAWNKSPVATHRVRRRVRRDRTGTAADRFQPHGRGLRERERIRDLFGRHVGHEVAANAVRRNPELGGEERDVAVLFVDVIGSTTIAATNSPTAVVALLNRFFDVIVDEVDAHGGFVNKFEGDAALAIFGAPTTLDDHAGSALAAARKIQQRLRAEVPEVSAGIGVAAGIAVAGNVGARKIRVHRHR